MAQTYYLLSIMDKGVLQDSGNTFKTAANVVKQPSGFLKDCQRFIFQENGRLAL